MALTTKSLKGQGAFEPRKLKVRNRNSYVLDGVVYGPGEVFEVTDQAAYDVALASGSAYEVPYDGTAVTEKE
jgi:hypothetical protein